MSTAPVVVTGVVTPDGSLTIDQKVPLPAGPVRISIQPTLQEANVSKDWWARMQESRAELETRGGPFRSAEEIEAEREAFREE